MQCGVDGGKIEKDEETGKCYFVSSQKRINDLIVKYSVCDSEKSCMTELNRIMTSHTELSYYIQDDCRGFALYIIRPGDIPPGKPVDEYYNNGIAVVV